MTSTDGSTLRLGVIGGSGLLKSEMIQSIARTEFVASTKFGDVKLRKGHLSPKIELIFVQRHAASTEVEYSQPHLINYQAIMQSLNDLKCLAVLGICSTGSMKHHMPIGSLVVPDDYFCPARILSVFDDHRGHTVPELHSGLRQEILNALFQGGMRPLDGGIYVNALGPRFETKSEVQFFKMHGDLIGMTGAHEASVAKELDIPYAMLALVDNMGNGIGSNLSIEEFYKAQAKNRPKIESAVNIVLNHFKKYPEVLSWLNVKPGKEQTRTVLADVVVHTSYIVTMNAANDILRDHAVVFHETKIVEILESTKADEKYGAFTTGEIEIVRLPDCALMPGMINAHTHAPMVFLRGYSDDMPLVSWLQEKIWPAEGRCVSGEFSRQGAQLACAEMITGGTTCFNDMYFFPEDVADVIDECGMRGFVGCVLIEFPSAYASDADAYLKKGEEMVQSNKWSSRVNFTVAPHSTYSVSEEHLVEAHTMAKRLGLKFHTHLHETEREVNDSAAGDRTSQFCHNCDKNCRPLKNLVDLGMVDDSLVAAHMVHLTEEEIEQIAKSGASTVHCPTSNLKLSSGFCPVVQLLKAGVNVAIGTDGAASNNSLDMFSEMKLAAILAKGVSKDPKALCAEQAMRMATINGAKALGIDHLVGSIEVGKQADVIAVNMSDLCSVPCYSIQSHLVYSTTRHQVSDVWVDGKRLLRNRSLVSLDESKIKRNAEKWKGVVQAN